MKPSYTPLVAVPPRWKVLPARAVFRPKLIRNIGLRERRVLSLSYGRIVVKPEERLRGLVPESFETYQVVEPDDIIIRTTDLQNDQESLRVGISEFRGIITAAYMCLSTTDRVAKAFGYQVLSAYDRLKVFYGYGSGLRQNLEFRHIKDMPVPVPPPEEQAAIVRFLDHVDRRIRRYIRAKQKLIRLLEEQKQAIIHRAVTRGLDSNVRLKPTGVEWLGEVPESWPLFRAKNILRQVFPRIPLDAEIVTCFRDGQVTLRRNRRTEGFTNAIKELGYQGIEPGQLVLHSMDAFAGAIGVSDSTGKCSPEYVICEPAQPGVLLDYFALLLRSLALRGLFVVLCPSVRERAPRVRYSDFSAFVLPKPPLAEQWTIVSEVRSACHTVEASATSARREVALLNEYRTRLISDVVTGKLDVRAAAARFPDLELEADSLNADTDDKDDGRGGEEAYEEGEESELLEVAEGEE